ncbi:T9SS type A sorting domain-containing protein, partial [candidate division KSB1 bacterium]|nr:T9SS type A sorting domain-containing protein [candidate division KSB1 bacterium]
FGDYEVSFYHDNISSNGVIITDADSDGDREIWTGRGDKTIALSLVGATSAPASPAGVQATPLDSSRISLSWYSVPGADSYEVLRGTNAEHLIYHVSTADAAFTDANLIAGRRYFYAVVTNDADRPVSKSLPSTPVSAVPGANPFLISATMETDNAIRLVFSEKMNESILEKNNYYPSRQLGSLSSVAADAGGRNVLLSFSRPFAETGTFLIFVKELYSENRVPIDTGRNSASVNIKKIAGPPYIKSAQLRNNNGLEVIFNEPMQLSTITDTANYDMGSEINIQSITTSGDQYDRVLLQLGMKQNFGAIGKVYSLKVQQVRNVAGIAIKPGRGDRIQLIFSKTTLDDVFVYPNPYKSGMMSEKMTFANLTARATIEIFDLHGRRLCILYEKDGDGGLAWNLDDDKGEKVSSGIYFYRVKADSQTFTGKLAIIR